MDNLKQADQGGREMRDIRIVHLPESDVDAAHAVGNEPEDRAGRMIAEFARKKSCGKSIPDCDCTASTIRDLWMRQRFTDTNSGSRSRTGWFCFLRWCRFFRFFAYLDI